MNKFDSLNKKSCISIFITKIVSGVIPGMFLVRTEYS